MYTRWLPFINNKNVILASGSQQRKQLISELGINFTSKTSDFPENLEKTSPKEYVNNTCYKKFEQFLESNADIEIDILITADTIVVHNNIIIEKPNNEQDIYDWFSKYSKDKVTVYTSVVIGLITKSENVNKVVNFYQFINETFIYFSEITKEMIEDYIETGEPFGRAGGFGIQGYGKTFIEKIEGCYYNVVGFPVHDFVKHLLRLLEETFGKDAWKENN
jgi:septum formation protein